MPGASLGLQAFKDTRVSNKFVVLQWTVYDSLSNMRENYFPFVLLCHALGILKWNGLDTSGGEFGDF